MRLVRQWNCDIGLASEKFHRHIHIRQAVFVGEVDRFLGMQKVVRFTIVFRPRVDGPQIL